MSAVPKPDVQAGVDAVVAIVESLAQAERYDGIVAILRAYRPCDHPTVTAGKDEICGGGKCWLDAVNRFATHRAVHDGVATSETMRLLGGGPYALVRADGGDILR